MIRLSVIIATYNRADSLMRTLDGLLAQTLAKESWELVVVDNNSTDDTAARIADFIAKNGKAINVRSFLETEQGISPARNRGFKEGVGEYFAFLDDDEVPTPEWVETYIEFFDSHPDAAEAGGRMIPLYEYETPKWLSKYTEVLLSGRFDKGDKTRPLHKGEYPFGGNIAFRRSTIEKYGMFSSQLGRTGKKLLGGEEKDYAYRLQAAGETIWYVAPSRIDHIIPRERLTRGFVVKLSRMVGTSERLRSVNISRDTYVKRLLAETIKWAGTIVLALSYTLTLNPAKGGYLILMRWHITRGLLGI